MLSVSCPRAFLRSQHTIFRGRILTNTHASFAICKINSVDIAENPEYAKMRTRHAITLKKTQNLPPLCYMRHVLFARLIRKGRALYSV